MIDLKALRDDPDRFRAGAKAKNYDVDVDALLGADRDLRAAQTQLQELTAEKNRIGKAIGQLAGRLKKAPDDEKAALQQEMAELQARPNQIKAQEAELTDSVRTLTAQRDELWLAVPQPPDDDVPRGASDADNVELSRWTGGGDGLTGTTFDPDEPFESQRGFAPKTHLELCADLGLVDFDRAVKIAGSRSYTLIGDGMRLHQAVLRLAFDTMAEEHGFTPVSAADLVRHETMVGTGFFPQGRDQVYDIANPTGDYGLALSGTGEVSLMAFRADELIDEAELPLRYVTMSTCFRREAGAAGRDTAGLYRVHQFDKVEQVVICKADEAESRAWHEKMLGYVEGLLKKLELPHRRLQCCTGDLGLKNADMIDVECWMPGRGELDAQGRPAGGWGETHSASRLYDYQCRRLNLRYRDAVAGQNLVAHSLNNTVAACPRLLIPILEMHQQSDGSVRVPEALRPYLGGRDRIG
ncbi:MAG: serine--tRNA ligase [Planctomycetota bacterium]